MSSTTRTLLRPKRILYVCPWAHWAGHPPFAAKKETPALVRAGAEVILCTFREVLNEHEMQPITHKTVVNTRLGSIIGAITNRLITLNTTPTRVVAWFLEQFTTLVLAIRLKKTMKCDIIYLRDGDPFIFVPILLGLISRHCRWIVSLVGVKAILTPESLPHSIFYHFVNSPIWKPIYRMSFNVNHFTFVCQNRFMKSYFETEYLDGILAGKVAAVHIGTENPVPCMPQSMAREYLELPENKTIFLHFGCLHSGKDIETVFDAIGNIPDTTLVQAGMISVRLFLMTYHKLMASIERRELGDKIIIKDYYIPEEEKQYYFNAADAVILSYKQDFLQTTSLLWEAVRFGSPVIASNVGELGELVKKYGIGLTFEPENPDSLGNALAFFTALNQEERDAMSRNCEQFCRDMSFDNWAEKHMEIM